MMKQRTKVSIYAGICVLYSILTFFLSYKQVNMVGTDIFVHMDTALYGSITYPVWHFVVKKLTMIGVSSFFSAAIITALFNGVTAVIICYICFREQGSFIQFLMPLAILFYGPLYIPGFNGGGYNAYYLGQIFANQWHNPTNIAVRPVACSIVLLTVSLFIKDKFRIKNIHYVVLNSLLMAISIFIKPSFMQIFLPACIIFTIYLILENSSNISKIIEMLISVLPAVVILIFQYLFFFGEGMGGIQISFFEVLQSYSKNIFISLIISTAFPILFFVFYWKELIRDKLYCFSLLLFFVGLGEFAFFVENNYRRLSGNFGWGLQLGLFIIVFVSVNKYQDKRCCSSNQSSPAKIWAKKIILDIALCYHTISGIGYYIYLLFFANTQL